MEIKFLGRTTTRIYSGDTSPVVTINDRTQIAHNGDCVIYMEEIEKEPIYRNCEYVYIDKCWTLFSTYLTLKED